MGIFLKSTNFSVYGD